MGCIASVGCSQYVVTERWPRLVTEWQQHAMIFKESHDAMRSVMWHKDQKSVCALVLAIVNEAQTL